MLDVFLFCRTSLPCLIFGVLGLVEAAPADVQPHAGMLRFADVGSDSIVFMYANDLWLVDREGGTARPLTTAPGQEMFPKFSDDGETIAFMGNYEGNRDLYTIPADGGVATRVTHHPASETFNDWTPDGRLLFFSNGLAGNARTSQLYTVSPDGGMPQKLPVPYGTMASISPDGKWLAYTPYTRDFRTWKRYRGGLAADIWLFHLKDKTSRKITDWEGTDTLPMWQNETIYYLSDKGESSRLNIWSYNIETKKREQITKFREYDVKFPSIYSDPGGAGAMIFQHGAELYLLDLGSRESKTVEVKIPGDRPQVRANTIDASGFVMGWGISSTGKRAVVEARGDIWTLPAEKGSPRNLTRTDGVAERDPAWSPDGRWIAYFSDKTGEYELYITQSDGQGETKQLTEDGRVFRYNPVWSPNSEHIVFTDKTGAAYLHTIESGETEKIDTDPWSSQLSVSWSHDNRWLTYAKNAEEESISSIWVYNVDTGEKSQVTSNMFQDSSPVFDREGNYLFFASNRAFAPEYSSVDTSFIYDDSEVLLAVPLREDMKSPWAPEIDEEEWDEEKEDEKSEEKNGKKSEDEKADDSEDKSDDRAGDDEDENDEQDENGDEEDADDDDNGDDADDAPAPKAADDGLSGTWECIIKGGEPLPPGGITITMTLSLSPDGSVTGSVSSPMGSGSLAGSFDKSSNTLTATITTDMGESELTATVTGDSMEGTISGQGMTFDLTGERTGVGTADDSDDDEDDKDQPEKQEEVTIDLENFEQRAMMLPVPPGSFRGLAVNNSNQLLYGRLSTRGAGGSPAIKVFDLEDEKKQEKTVAGGAASFDISGDGKKLLVVRGRGRAQIQKASAGASGKGVPTSGMRVRIDPRTEWKQIITDAWRIHRDFFYDPDMHGVDWKAVYDHYIQLLPDAANREDVSYIIGEMIAELNVGHAYYFGGDVEDQPAVSVGMLGADYKLQNGAYKITRIIEGGPWDADARGPLSRPGLEVKEGDYLLAVNGLEVDISQDPWAVFVGLAGKTITITVSDKPRIDNDAREVVLKPISNERNLRYRAWVESNRQYVEDETDGKVGYIHVPDTGVNGQNNLVRQYFGQIGKDALIIDERWNGGGQIPTRFVEILNRPVTNYWARRDGKNWTWPPDAHHGPKCMLINGPSGSGGDMFPFLFRQAGLGKLIGTRTWGGLVGISGNPRLIDGGYTAVPTFGFYEKDGTWGIEGHGVDPDIKIIDDPAKMQNGNDPQLNRAIELMLTEIRKNPYRKTKRPPYPDRSGMGVPEQEW